MFEVDMDLMPYVTSRHAMMGLMYAIAAKCRNQDQFEAVFEPKLTAPFVQFNSADLGSDLTEKCKALKELIKAVVEISDKLGPQVEKLREYRDKIREFDNDLAAKLKGDRNLLHIERLRITSVAEKNNDKIKLTLR